jgi:hypothetical protein
MIHTLAAGTKTMYLASSRYGDETAAPALATLTAVYSKRIVQPGVAV